MSNNTNKKNKFRRCVQKQFARMENTVQTLQRNICFDIFERTHSRRKPACDDLVFSSAAE